VRCEAISICAADGAAEPASNSCAREAQQQWQLPARAEEQKKQERRANNSTSQRVDSGADTIREQSNETPRNIRFFVATGIAATLITPT